MKKDYRYFYLSMMFGTGLIAGMFYSLEFGFYTWKFAWTGFLTIFPVLCSYLYLKECVKERQGEQ